MGREAIFGPVAVLGLWTLAVLFMTGLRRIRGTIEGRIPRGAFNLGETPAVPRDVALFNRNLMNLLEMPVLFYVACLVLYVTSRVHPVMLGLGWLYVLLRLIHSFIHVTSNRVIPRLISFAAGNVVLLVIWIWVLLGAI
jgi:hypothetical protein